MNKKKLTISWSGGKDSAFALHKILQSGQYEVVGLHTVFGEETKRVGLHGIREELIEQQADALSLPLTKLYLKESENHAAYEKLMKEFYSDCTHNHIDAIMFGDIFLEDLRKYREELLKESGIFPVYPIWKLDTSNLLKDFIRGGFKTLLCSANANYFSEGQLGNELAIKFLETLTPGVDPCGENGEFHTFVFDGPVFRQPVRFVKGAVTSKMYSYLKKNDDGSLEKIETAFWFQDLLPLMAS